MSYAGLRPNYKRVSTDEFAFSKTTVATSGQLDNITSFVGYSAIMFSGAPTITGVTKPADSQMYAGKLIVISNAHATTDLTIKNNSTSSTIENRIFTGTGSDLSLAAGASLLLMYDNSGVQANHGWRVVGGAGGGGGGTTVKIAQTGVGSVANLAYIGKALYLNGSTWTLANYTSDTTAEVIGLIGKITDDNNIELTLGGEVLRIPYADVFETTPNDGDVVWLGSVSGKLTTTPPSTVGQIKKPLGSVRYKDSAVVGGSGFCSVMFNNMIGTTVGGTNLYTTIPLNGSVSVQTVTSLQTVNVAAGEGGFIEGVIKIDATTDYVTTFKVEFARPITGTAYTCTPTYGCDALPTGSSIDITSGGVIQLTLPAIPLFSSGSARFSMQAAAVGATLPLQIPSSQITWSEPTMFRNRIINGNMAIDQRNNGASTTGPVAGYTLDRWTMQYSQSGKLTAQRGMDAMTRPDGFSNCIGVAGPGSAYSPLAADIFCFRQILEGYSVTDLCWGTSSAKPVTLSFWIRATTAGTYSASLRAYDGTNFSSQVKTYTLAANTWTYVSLTFSALTTQGMQLGTSAALYVSVVDLGSGTDTETASTDTWVSGTKLRTSGSVKLVNLVSQKVYITGVQLEPGTVATPFEFRPYGTELQLCQRYYEVGFVYCDAALSSISTVKGVNIQYKVDKRISVAVTGSLGTSITIDSGTTHGCRVYTTATSSILGDWTASAQL